MNQKKIIEAARKRLRRLQKLRKDPRYLKTIGRLKREGFLDIKDVPEYRGQVFLSEALWAAEIEPRIHELLPTILARRPKFFAYIDVPADLTKVAKEVKAGRATTPYKGIAPERYFRWANLVGRKQTLPKRMRSFRLSPEDLLVLENLATKMAITHTQVLHLALASFSKADQD